MFIQLEKVMPNSSVAKKHVIDSIQIRGSVALVQISSYAAGDVLSWLQNIEIPYIEIKDDPCNSTAAYLVRTGNLLEGGLVGEEVSDLDVQKANLNRTIERLRDQHLSGGCTVLGDKKIDTDRDSQLNISGAVSMALIAKSSGAPFSTKWRLRDNNYVNLSADQMVGVGITVGQFVASVYAASFSLKDQVDSAVDQNALNAIDVKNFTWPS